MQRKLAVLVAVGVAAGGGVAAGAAFAAGEKTAGHPRDWFDFVDIGVRLATLCVFLGGLVGTFAAFSSLRGNIYGQVYARFQAMLLKLAEHPEWYDRMKREEYDPAEDGPDGPTHPHRFLANAMVNLYEEAFLLREARVMSVFDTVPPEYWASMVGSMRGAFRLRYVRTFWERRQGSFPETFNRFVKAEILPTVAG